jgi:U3 small nucleolar RNA-associated protein 3
MGKKRKAIKPAQTSEPGDFDPAESRLGPVNTYEDIADSEEEYFINQDKILLEEEPRSKRQKRIEEEDALLEFSDEEVLAHDDPDDEGSDGGLDAAALRRASKLVKRSTADSDDEEKDTAREEDPGWWGPSKKEYYDGDLIETQEDALEEEAEAKRLQRKKLTKMAEEDFIESEWLDSKDSVEEGVVVTEVLKDLDIPNDMGSEDRYQLLTSRYPEFEFLAAEFQDLEPKLTAQQKEVEGKPIGSPEVVKYWVLASYVAALACYFAL